MTSQRDKVRTEFGELLERYRKQAKLSQEAFAREMSEKGYPNFSQRTYSHIIYHPSARVYPYFFQMAGDVLNLRVSEQQALLQAWLSLENLPDDS